MCGIAGLVGSNSKKSLVEEMIARISHRGPDGNDVIEDLDHCFGHARLAIIDIELGKQPMLSQSGRWLIAFNGEIYNFKELRRILSDAYRFETTSDTETILAAVEVHGLEKGLSLIDGMYAIALFDRDKRELHLARDHFGIKPLYWTHQEEGRTAFASELKAFQCLNVDFEIDQVSVVTQLLCRFIPAPFTGRKNIFKLRPGELLSFSNSGSLLRPSRRICPASSAQSLVNSPDLDRTKQLLKEAVARQTVSDVPIGVLLSGGIDSALVTQFASQSVAGLNTFCAGYGVNDEATEFVEAGETASLLNTSHKNIVVEREEFSDSLRKSIWHLEEPVATTSLVTYSLLCKAVSRERKVVLSGQGADEPWAGYSRHRFEALLNDYPTIIHSLRTAAKLGVTMRDRLKEILSHLDDETGRWVAYRSLFPQKRIQEVFGTACFEEAMHRISDALTWADNQLPSNNQDSFSRLLKRDCYTDLSDNLLLLSDKLSMAWGLEVRVPMLDVAYASHVINLPPSAKRDGFLKSRGKALHKDVASLSLPSHIINRKKKGFETPLSSWLSGKFGVDLVNSIYSKGSAISSLMPVDELLARPANATNISYELQQQIFSLWVTNEWASI